MSISQATIDVVNREVAAIPGEMDQGSKRRGEYIKVTDKERAIIGNMLLNMELQQLFVFFKSETRFQH